MLDHSDLLTRVKLCVQNPAGSLDASPDHPPILATDLSFGAGYS